MASLPERDENGRNPDAGGNDRSGMIRFAPTMVPIGLLALVLILPAFMFENDQTASSIGLGPGAWPGAMLIGLALFSALWMARDLWALSRAGRAPMLRMPKDDEYYHFGKALVGLALIVAYGWLLPILGFALSTAAFVTIWCLFSGLRNPLVVAPVVLIGTIALLWLFMGLALMPLPRGAGVFGEFSIWLLRTTGIY